MIFTLSFINGTIVNACGAMNSTLSILVSFLPVSRSSKDLILTDKTKAAQMLVAKLEKNKYFLLLGLR